MKDKSSNISNMRSVDRALDVLECFFNTKNGLSLIEISQVTELSPSTVHRILATLQQRGFLTRNEDNKKYFIGNIFLELAKSADENIQYVLKKVAYPQMKLLRDKYNETMALYIADGKDKLCIERIECTRPLRHHINVGDRVTLKKGSAGKILLAYMEVDQRKKIISEKDPLYKELKEVRTNGYAISMGEREAGLFGVSAPIVNKNGKMFGAITLSGPAIRFSEENLSEFIEDTVRCARNISDLLDTEI